MAQKQLAIIFDLDGTLIDVSGRHYFIYSKLTKKFSGRPLPKPEYWELKRAQTKWPVILKKSGIDPNKTDSYLDEFIELIEQPEYLRADQILPGASETLEKLKDYPKYLVSLRRHEDRVKDELEYLGLSKYFQKIIIAHADSESYKLKATKFKQLLGNKPALTIGDTEADVLAAKEAGMISVAVETGIRTPQLLQKLKADYQLKSVKELPGVLAKLPEAVR